MQKPMYVAATTPAPELAAAVAELVRQVGSVELQAIGAGAINQAVKAIAIARGYVAPQGLDLVCAPAFITVTIAGAERSALRFIVRPTGEARATA